MSNSLLPPPRRISGFCLNLVVGVGMAALLASSGRVVFADGGDPSSGYPSSGYPSSGYPYSGYPNSSYPSSGYPNSSYPSSGYPSSSYPNSGYPNSGYPNSGYPNSGYPNSGYPSSGMSTGGATDGGMYTGGMFTGGLFTGGMSGGDTSNGGMYSGGLFNGGMYMGGMSTGGGYPSSGYPSSGSSSAALPSAPSYLSTMIGDHSVYLYWMASDGATTYNIYRGVAGGQEGLEPVATGVGGMSGTSWTDINVQSGTTYYYTVRAENSAGGSGSSPEASANIPNSTTGSTSGSSSGYPSSGYPSSGYPSSGYPSSGYPSSGYPSSGYPSTSPPSAPSSLGASAMGSTLYLYWMSSQGATSYNIYRGTAAGQEATVPVATNVGGMSSSTWTDAAANSGTTYYYTVTAVNNAGESAYSPEASDTIAASTSGSTTGAGSGYPTMGGYASSGYPTMGGYPSSGYPTMGGYPSSGYPSSGYPTMGGYPSSGYPSSGYPSSGYPTSGYPSSGNPSPTLPPPPSYLMASATAHSIYLYWMGVQGAISYNIYRGVAAGQEGLEPVATGVGGMSGTTWTDMGVQSGTTYYYTVRAVNAVGESNSSIEASTTLPVSSDGLTTGSSSGSSETSATGGVTTGGVTTGGVTTGGVTTGGVSTDGSATGGASTGGASTGGASTGHDTSGLSVLGFHPGDATTGTTTAGLTGGTTTSGGLITGGLVTGSLIGGGTDSGGGSTGTTTAGVTTTGGSTIGGGLTGGTTSSGDTSTTTSSGSTGEMPGTGPAPSYWTVTSSSTGKGHQTVVLLPWAQPETYDWTQKDIGTPKSPWNVYDFKYVGGGVGVGAYAGGSFSIEVTCTITYVFKWHPGTDTPDPNDVRIPGPRGTTMPTRVYLVETSDAGAQGDSRVTSQGMDAFGDPAVSEPNISDILAGYPYWTHSSGRRVVLVDATSPTPGASIDTTAHTITVSGTTRASASCSQPATPSSGGFLRWNFNAVFDDRTVSLHRNGAHDERYDADGTGHGDTRFNYGFLSAPILPVVSGDWNTTSGANTFAPIYSNGWSIKLDTGLQDVTSTWDPADTSANNSNVTNKGSADIGGFTIPTGAVRYDAGLPPTVYVHPELGMTKPDADLPQTQTITYTTTDNKDNVTCTPKYVLTMHDEKEFHTNMSYLLACDKANLYINGGAVSDAAPADIPGVQSGDVPAGSFSVSAGAEDSTGGSFGISADLFGWLGLSRDLTHEHNVVKSTTSTCPFIVHAGNQRYAYYIDWYQRTVAQWRQFDYGGENKRYDQNNQQIYYFDYGDFYSRTDIVWGDEKFLDTPPDTAAGVTPHLGPMDAGAYSMYNDTPVPQPSQP